MTASADARERLRQWLVSGRPPEPASAGDAEALTEAAGEQRLTALLHAALSARAAGASSSWPAPVLEAMRAEHRRLLARGVGQLDLAARVSALLAARGLRMLPLKGAALAESSYSSVAERPMADVDVLALDQWRASVRALEEAGFVCVERADHAWSFVDPLGRGFLELHRSVTSCPGVYPLDVEGVWGRAERADGQVSRVPGREDLLVQLAEHALFQHGGVLSLGQWLDFRRLVEARPLDRGRFDHATREPQVAACVRLALLAAESIVGGTLVAASGPDVRLPRALRRWLEAVRRTPASALFPGTPALARLRWHLARGRRWALVKGTLAAPRDQGGEAESTAWASTAGVIRRAALVARRWGATVLR